MHAADRLDQSIGRTGSLACVGLDPRPALLPDTLKRPIIASHGAGAEGVAEVGSVGPEGSDGTVTATWSFTC